MVIIQKSHRLHRQTHDFKNVLSFSKECLKNTLLDYIIFVPHTSKHIKKTFLTLPSNKVELLYKYVISSMILYFICKKHILWILKRNYLQRSIKIILVWSIIKVNWYRAFIKNCFKYTHGIDIFV